MDQRGGQLISAASLARYPASVARLAGRSPWRPRALRAAAVAGGGLASASLATSGLTAASLTGRASEDPDRAVAAARRAFLAGGPIHGVGLGLLMGALGFAGARTGELPRPLATAALVTAAVNPLGTLYLVAEPAGWFIPAGRFPALIITGISAVRLAAPSKS